MKKVKTIYWILTGLLAALMLFSGISGLTNAAQAKALITTHLGYPAYFGPMISITKILGVIAILVPGFPRLKEWAYAGFTFDLLFAVVSFIAVGDPVTGTIPLLIGLALIFGSYIYYHKKKRLAAAGFVPQVEKKIPEPGVY
jgi:uncharacterized membrane protein YphA (DoxX/SURF4 family)